MGDGCVASGWWLRRKRLSRGGTAAHPCCLEPQLRQWPLLLFTPKAIRVPVVVAVHDSSREALIDDVPRHSRVRVVAVADNDGVELVDDPCGGEGRDASCATVTGTRRGARVHGCAAEHECGDRICRDGPGMTSGSGISKGRTGCIVVGRGICGAGVERPSAAVLIPLLIVAADDLRPEAHVAAETRSSWHGCGVVTSKVPSQEAWQKSQSGRRFALIKSPMRFQQATHRTRSKWCAKQRRYAWTSSWLQKRLWSTDCRGTGERLEGTVGSGIQRGD